MLSITPHSWFKLHLSNSLYSTRNLNQQFFVGRGGKLKIAGKYILIWAMKISSRKVSNASATENCIFEILIHEGFTHKI